MSKTESGLLTGFRGFMNNAKILSIGFGVDPKAEWTSETFFRFPGTRFLDLFFISHGDGGDFMISADSSQVLRVALQNGEKKNKEEGDHQKKKEEVPLPAMMPTATSDGTPPESCFPPLIDLTLFATTTTTSS